VTTKTIDKDSCIAAYLRKSREDNDTDDTLRKHRDTLKEFVEKNGFTNVHWFEEIGSGGSIDERPVFSELLPRIYSGEFDAVLAVAQDRLSRGDTLEQGIIHRAFKKSNTILLLPSGELIDFNDKNQGLFAGIKGVFSNYELEVIKERLRNGKMKAVKDGRPHSGNPPYAYKWDKNTKSCVTDEEQSKVYRLMLEWYLKEGLSGSLIAERLNEMKVRTPSGRGVWHGEVVTSLLTNDFHRGYVVFGRYTSEKRTRGRYVTRKSENPDSVIVAKGNHEVLKSDEEHAAIMKRIETLRTYNMKDRQVRKNTYRLSGLVYCPHCGKCQGVGQPKGRKEHLRKCLKKSTTRTAACDDTKGINEEVIYLAVLHKMKQKREELFSPNESHSNDTANSLNDILEIQRLAIEKSKRRIENAKEMRLDGDMDKAEFKAIKEKEEAAIRKAEEKISDLKSSIGFLDKAEEKKRLERWSSEDVTRLLAGESIQASEVNAILRSLIERVTYSFNDKDELDVKIRYK
jgi:site-specific DNA recombinase